MGKKLRRIFRKFDTYQLLSILLLIFLLWFSIDIRPSEIRIGIVLPLSGASSTRAASHERGIKLAAEHVNKSGGINGKKLTLISRNNDENQAQTAINMRDLIYEDQVTAVVGGISPINTRIIQQYCEKAQVPFLTGLCTHHELTENSSDYTFRSITDDKKQFEAICEFSTRRFQARKPALIFDPVLFGQESAQKFIEAALKNGQQVVAAVSYSPGIINFRKQLETLKATNPDALVIIAPPLESAMILRQARENRFLKPILGVNPFSSHEFIDYAGIYSESTICTLPFNPRMGGQRADYFLSEFLEKFGVPADADAAMGYEAIMLLALALKAGEYDRQMVRNYLASMHGWESITGSGGFDQSGNQVRPAEVAIIKDRQKIPVNLEELF
ncbi:MAG: ABC transporter substrate-binding protein [Candidatus Riflebacteria bacterium]